MSILNTYPVFEDNQVLTSSQLNQLATYLDQQTRLTRRSLIGIGIVCGLEPSYVTVNGSPYVKISEGKGVTSEGYMISMAETTCDRIRAYDLPNDMDYPPFQLGGQLFPGLELWELLSTDYQPQPGDTLYNLNALPASPLNMTADQFIRGTGGDSQKVVLVFLESSDIDLKSCLGRACDEFGKDRTFVVRKLLVSMHDLLTIILANTGTPDLLFPGKFDLPTFSMPRVLLDPSLSTATDYGALSQAYATAIKSVYINVLNGIRMTYTVFRPLLEEIYGVNSPFSNIPTNGLTEWVSLLNGVVIGGPNFLGIQYFYDFVKDLILAYEEFRLEAFEFMSGCCLSSSLFPKHLVLGEAYSAPGSKPSKVRDNFIGEPVSAEQRESRGRLIMLHKRIVLMLRNFDIDRINNPASGLNLLITPSFEKKSMLSARAIPYYYKIDVTDAQLGKLEANWNYRLVQQYRNDTSNNWPVLAYGNQFFQTPPVPLDPIQTPLFYDIDAYDFFRIEGHLRKTVTDVTTQINNLRNQYDLPFNFVALRLKGQATTQEILARCHFDDLRSQYIAYRNEMVCRLTRVFNHYFTSDGSDIAQRSFSLFFEAIRHDITSGKGNASVAFVPVGNGLSAAVSNTKILTAAEAQQVSTPLTLPDVNSYLPRKIDAIINSLTAAVNQLKVLLNALLTQHLTETLDTFNYGTFLTTRSLGSTIRSAIDLNERANQLSTGPASNQVQQEAQSPNALPQVAAQQQQQSVSINQTAVPTGGFIKAYLDTVQVCITIKANLNEFVDQVLHNTKTKYNAEFYMAFSQSISEEMWWLNELIADCGFRKLEAVYYMLQYRLNYMKTNDPQLFSNFLKKNPGVTHMGGVPSGGTHIVVYPGDPLSFDIKTRNQVAQQINLITDLELRRADLSARVDLSESEFVELDTVRTQLCQLYEVQTHNVLTANIAGVAVAEPVFNIPQIPIKRFAIDANQVVADFALPYLSNCDCVCDDIPNPTVTQLNIPALAIPAFFDYKMGDYAFANDSTVASTAGCTDAPVPITIDVFNSLNMDERDGGQVIVCLVRNGDTRVTQSIATVDTVPTERGGTVATTYLNGTTRMGFRYTPPRNFCGVDSFEYVFELRRSDTSRTVLRSNKARVSVSVSKSCPAPVINPGVIEIDRDLFEFNPNQSAE